jgi:hypothetical protein
MTTAEALITDAKGVTDRADPTARADEHLGARSGCDGAGWFLLILTVALVYGLAVSAISATAGEATSGTPARPTAAVIADGSP